MTTSSYFGEFSAGSESQKAYRNTIDTISRKHRQGLITAETAARQTAKAKERYKRLRKSHTEPLPTFLPDRGTTCQPQQKLNYPQGGILKPSKYSALTPEEKKKAAQKTYKNRKKTIRQKYQAGGMTIEEKERLLEEARNVYAKTAAALGLPTKV